MRAGEWGSTIGGGAAVAGLPLLGTWWSGGDVAALFQFPPPLEIPTDYLRFSWAAVVAVVVFLAVVIWPWLTRRTTVARSVIAGGGVAVERRLPSWGWLALVWSAGWWVLAWTRWEWFAPLQRYTFFPLWFGYIVGMNALVERRTGSCFMRRHPGRWVALFGASSVCWWGFEWLNRFVHNWHYLGVEGISAVEYAVHASVCFSTVLPAVMVTAEWIGSHPAWITRTVNGPRWAWMRTRGAALALLVFGIVSLAATGVFPTLFYPALWVSPLALALAIPVLRGRSGIAEELAAGDWRRAATWMIAALVCGFFWEMWNWLSLAKWIYTVPGVERWHVFEMPLLGYAGYLPFGLECLIATELVVGKRGSEGGDASARPPARS